MKNEIQAQLYNEYLANKDKYRSYVQFMEEHAKESEWVQKTMRRFKRAPLNQR